MKKKLLLMLAVVAALTFAACSSKPQETKPAETTAAATEAVEDEEPNVFTGDAVVDDNGKLEQLEQAMTGWEADRDAAYKKATANGQKAPGDRYVRSKEEDVIKLVNVQRQKAGLGPLSLDETMMAGAETRANEQKKAFSHTRPDGRDCFSIFAELNIPANYRGENVGMGGICSADAIMNMWMNSEGHRANIMNPKFSRIGVGYYESGNYGYWAQIFAN